MFIPANCSSFSMATQGMLDILSSNTFAELKGVSSQDAQVTLPDMSGLPSKYTYFATPLPNQHMP